MHGVDPLTVARVQFVLDDRLGLDAVRVRIAALLACRPLADRGPRRAPRRLLRVAARAHRRGRCARPTRGATPEVRVDAWLADHARRGRALPQPGRRRRARRRVRPRHPRRRPPRPPRARRPRLTPPSLAILTGRLRPQPFEQARVAQRRARPVRRRMRSAASAARAALAPHAPCTPPPGCADADARYRPRTGVSARPEPGQRPEHELLGERGGATAERAADEVGVEGLERGRAEHVARR